MKGMRRKEKLLRNHLRSSPMGMKKSTNVMMLLNRTQTSLQNRKRALMHFTLTGQMNYRSSRSVT